jgi:accessory gene regulator B
MNQSNLKSLQNLKGKLNNMSEKIADWLIRQKAISADERELYAYAVHCLFSLIYPLVFSLVIGAFLGMPIEAVAMIIPFIVVRKFSGGYHADSFYKCLIISSIVIVTMLQISKYINNNMFFNVIYIGSSILLMIFSPIDSANKRLDNDDKRFCKKVTILIVLVLFIIVELLWIAGYRHYTKYIEVGVILAELLQIVAIFKVKYSRK